MRSPSQTAGGALLSLKHPDNLRGNWPEISLFQITLPVSESQHQAMMSLPSEESSRTGFKVVKYTLPFDMTGVL
jgi:hypothetical protein